MSPAPFGLGPAHRPQQITVRQPGVAVGNEPQGRSVRRFPGQWVSKETSLGQRRSGVHLWSDCQDPKRVTTKGAGVQRWPGQFGHQTWEEGPALRTRSATRTAVLWPPGPARGRLSTSRGHTPARDGPGSAATGKTRMGLAEPMEKGQSRAGVYGVHSG